MLDTPSHLFQLSVQLL